LLVRLAIAVLVLKNNDTVAARTDDAPVLVHGEAIVRALIDPNAPTLIHVHVRRIHHHRLGGEERDFQSGGGSHPGNIGGGGGGAVGVRGRGRLWFGGRIGGQRGNGGEAGHDCHSATSEET
jgi:hypothetical protein